MLTCTLAALLAVLGVQSQSHQEDSAACQAPDIGEEGRRTTHGVGMLQRKTEHASNRATNSQWVESKQEHQRQQQRWIYAFQTCALPQYVNQLQGQLRTWAANISKDNMLIIGGPYDNGDGRFACDEGPSGQNCKEATVLFRAAGHAKKVNADWLFHVIDDAYVFLPRVKKVMEGFDPSEPVVFAGFGCGRAWKYHEESNGGKKPKPANWEEPEYHCEAAWRQGGICTGAGYIVSRAALELLPRNHTLASFVQNYLSLTVGRSSDISTTCLLYDRGITVRPFPETGLNMANAGGEGRENNAEKVVAGARNGLVHIAMRDHAMTPLFMDELYKVERSENDIL
jgi:hypothetical protein